MSRGVEIPFIAGVAKWLKGTRDVEKSLDDVADSLDDLASDSARESDRAADRIKKSYREAAREVSKAADAAADDLGTKVRRGAQNADQGVTDLKRNTAQNAKEMGASFQDVGSAIDGLQGLAAEALEGFGAAGVGAGVAIAAGIGIAQAALQATADKVNKLAEDAGELATQFRDATDVERVELLTQRWDELSAKIVDPRSWFEPWQDSAVTAIDRVGAAATTNADLVDRLLAGFADPDITNRARELADVYDDARNRADSLGTQIDELTRRQAAWGYQSGRGIEITEDWTDADTRRLEQLRQQRNDLQGLIPVLKDEVDVTARANDLLSIQARVRGMSVDAYVAEQAAIERANAAQQSYVDSLAAAGDPVTAYETLLQRKTEAERIAAEATAASTADASDSWETYAGEVKVSIEDLINDLNTKITQRAAFEQNLASIASAGGQALADELRAQGPEAAAATAQLIADATPEQQRRYFALWGLETGQAAGSGMATGIEGSAAAIQQAAINAAGKVTPPQLVYGANVSGLQAAADAAARTLRPPEIVYRPRIGSPQAV